jgi:hypothetical protein
MITARAGAALLVLGLVSGTTACGGDSGSGTAATVPSVPATSAPTPTPSPTTNGIDTLPPYDAQVAAREAFLTAPAVRLTGQVGDSGSFDIRTSANGDAAGTLRGNGVRADFLVIGRTVWLSGNRAFWVRGLNRRNIPSDLTHKYVRTTLGSRYARALKTMTTRAEFASLWNTDGIPDGREVVRGVAAYRFRDLRTGLVISVALTGEPYPLRLAGDDGQPIEIVVDDKPMTVMPPRAADVVATLP